MYGFKVHVVICYQHYTFQSLQLGKSVQLCILCASIPSSYYFTFFKRLSIKLRIDKVTLGVEVSIKYFGNVRKISIERSSLVLVYSDACS